MFLRESRLQEVSKFKFSILVVNKPLFPEKGSIENIKYLHESNEIRRNIRRFREQHFKRKENCRVGK